MSDRMLLFIVNPAAGHGRAMKRWEAGAGPLIQKLKAAVWMTKGPGDAGLLAQRALKQGFEAIIAVGGDGTLSETVHGYLSAAASVRRRAFLGTWPAGSGCDMARHFKIVRDAARWMKWFKNPNIQHLDAGRVSFVGYDGKPAERFFFNIAALGIAGEVALRGKKGGKPLGGTLSYMVDSMIALATNRAKFLEISINGIAQPRESYHLIALANTRSTGGGMLIAPKADAQDGQLDFIGVGDMWKWGLLRRFWRIYFGWHIGKRGVTHRLVRRVEVRCDETVHLNIDGEAAGTLPATFDVLPGAVPFLCPIL